MFTFSNEVKAFLLQCEIKATHYNLLYAASHVGVSAVDTQVIVFPIMLFKDSKIFSQSQRIAEIGRHLQRLSSPTSFEGCICNFLIAY